jgi:hypothetical protein
VTEEALLLWGEEIVAPRDRGAQHALALGEVARAVGQQGEAVPQTGQQRLWREDRATRGGEFDRQRQTIEANADFGHRSRIALCDRELRLDRIDSRREEGNGGGCERRLWRQRVREVGRRQRRYVEEVFPADMQRRAARRQDRDAGTAGQDLGDIRRGGGDLLAVIEQEEVLLPRQVIAEVIKWCAVARIAQIERAGDRGHNQRRVAERS